MPIPSPSYTQIIRSATDFYNESQYFYKQIHKYLENGDVYKMTKCPLMNSSAPFSSLLGRARVHAPY